MWIRTYNGTYINSDRIFTTYLADSKYEGCVIGAKVDNDSRPVTIAEFNTREDGQLFLDRMMKACGIRIFEVDKADWNYTGHKKDHKETRHGGS